MKLIIRYCVFIAAALIVLEGVAFLAGCEFSSNNELTIDPPETTLGQTDGSITLTASYSDSSMGKLALPLKWSVHNPELGMITGSSDFEAVYVRFHPNGVNVVEVKDQYGAKGVAAIEQVTTVSVVTSGTTTTTTLP
ncbi:MAG: hypothetical protein JXN60_00085 [Lentisphaerae bacterium]|nr:hypothetical protein [Lentisphaerota bacterium]